jgi:hypothetical protein
MGLRKPVINQMEARRTPELCSLDTVAKRKNFSCQELNISYLAHRKLIY